MFRYLRVNILGQISSAGDRGERAAGGQPLGRGIWAGLSPKLATADFRRWSSVKTLKARMPAVLAPTAPATKRPVRRRVRTAIAYSFRDAKAKSFRSIARASFLGTLSSSRLTNSAARSSSSAPRYFS